MKFLTKKKSSAILAGKVVYTTGRDNRRLRKMLLEEQKGFCAYTEKYVSKIDSTEVEHFDRTKKDKGDNYFNYYAVLRDANLRKLGKENRHTGAKFFISLFFQDENQPVNRIRYVTGEFVYEETDATDDEAAALIDFLGFNDRGLVEERENHVRRLRDLFKLTTFDNQRRRDWFAEHPEHLSFVTAVEQELDIDLSLVLDNLS